MSVANFQFSEPTSVVGSLDHLVGCVGSRGIKTEIQRKKHKAPPLFEYSAGKNFHAKAPGKEALGTILKIL